MPPTQIEVLEDRSAETPSDQGFVRVRRLTVRARYEDGTQSEPFRYDVADREALDAVMMVLYAPGPHGRDDPLVCMRTALRPPLALRRHRSVPVLDAHSGPEIWEMPAGLIEPGERGEAAVLATAARETEEEVGYKLLPSAFERLGAAVYLTPGVIAEKLHVVRAEVDRSRPAHATATEVVEKGARVEWWPLSVALARASRGEIEDCKTELGLHRLRAYLNERAGR